MNGTVFTYGQTSSGKTFTMTGAPSHPGVVQLSTSEIFDTIAQSSRAYTVRVSYMEIYNENIRDLLSPNNDNLRIKENTNREIFVGGLTEAPVKCAAEVAQIMSRGEEHRHFGVTNMNERSSRSHTIFRFVIESREQATDCAESGGRVAYLNLVDLAGSERARQTGAEGARLKEGSHINRSLLTLTTVIGKLSEGNDNVHIPFRDSKLTRILQPSLGGNARTAIIATVTPAGGFAEETTSTLKFASRAKEVKNRPEVNEMTASDAVLLQRARDELAEVKRKLAEAEAAAAAAAAAAAEEEAEGMGMAGMTDNATTSDGELARRRTADGDRPSSEVKRVRIDASVLENLRAEKFELAERLAAAEARFQEKVSECDVLLADFEAAEERAVAAEKEVDETQEALKQEEEKVVNAAAQAEQRERDMQEVQGELLATVQALEAEKAARAAAEEQIVLLEGEKEAALGRFAEEQALRGQREAEIESIRAQMSETISEHEVQMASAQEVHAAELNRVNEAHVVELNGVKEAHVAAMASLSSEHEASMQLKDEIHAEEIAALISSHEETLSAAKSTHAEQISSLESEILAAAERFSLLESQFTSTSAVAARVPELEESISELREALRSAESSLAASAVELASVKEVAERVPELEEKAAELLGALQAAEAELREVRPRAERMESAEKALEECKEELEAEREKAQVKDEQHQASMEEARASIKVRYK